MQIIAGPRRRPLEIDAIPEPGKSTIARLSVIEAIKNGFAGPDLKAEWDELQAHKTALIGEAQTGLTGGGAQSADSNPGREMSPTGVKVRASAAKRATRTERGGDAPSERACKGVRGAKPLG